MPSRLTTSPRPAKARLALPPPPILPALDERMQHREGAIHLSPHSWPCRHCIARCATPFAVDFLFTATDRRMQHLLCHSSLASASPSKQCVQRLPSSGPRRPRSSPCRRQHGHAIAPDAMKHLHLLHVLHLPLSPTSSSQRHSDRDTTVGSPTRPPSILHACSRHGPLGPDRAQDKPALPPLPSSLAASLCPPSPPATLL
jgi:hypothetical protein